MQRSTQEKELSLYEIAVLYEIPYSMIAQVARKMRGGRRTQRYGVKYTMEELRPYLLDIINSRLVNAEKQMESLSAMKRNIEKIETEA